MREMDQALQPSIYDFPTHEITLEDQTRILRKIMSMRALSHHAEVFDKIQTIFGKDKTSNIEQFQSIFFSYEEPDHIKVLT